MPLNIVANRKLSLKGFAEGWDDCYLIVRGVSEERRLSIIAEANGDKSDAAQAPIIRDFCLEVIVGGVVLSTKEDGSTELVEITKSDLPTVVDALNIAWRNEVAAIATGTDRLKAMI